MNFNTRFHCQFVTTLSVCDKNCLEIMKFKKENRNIFVIDDKNINHLDISSRLSKIDIYALSKECVSVDDFFLALEIEIQGVHF